MGRKFEQLRTIVVTTPERIEADWLTRIGQSTEIDLVERVAVITQVLPAVEQKQPDLVIIERELAHAEQCIRQILAVAPQTMCIAAISQPDITALRRLMAIGARDVLEAPLNLHDLLGSVRQVRAAEIERRATEQQVVRKSDRGRLVVPIAPKGGVGTTTIATNLAIALKEVSNRPVALVDMSLQFGDVGVHLNLRPRYTMMDLLKGPEIDDAMLKRVLTPHESGVQALLAPGDPDAAAHINGSDVERILNVLLERYAYVIVDTWSFLDELAETLLRRADEVLLIATPEIPTLKNAKRLLEVAMRHELLNGRLTVVLNRFPSVEGISLEDVQQHLHHNVGANIPSDGQLMAYSINRGIPVVVSHPQSWMAQNLLRLAGHLAGDDVNPVALTAAEARSERKNGFRRWGFRKAIQG